MSKMKLIMENFRKQMKNESQWGGFTGGAAPLDSEQRELPEMPYEQQLDLFSLIVNRGDKDPKELLYHPENFQNGLSFPDLSEEDVEDILDKLGLPELGDPSWQQNIVGRPAVQNEGLPEPYKEIDASSFEGELLDYLEKNPRGVNVAMMRYAFGGSSQKWTRMLQGMVNQGKLEQSGEMYKLAAMGEAKNKDGKEQGADGKACWDGYKHAGTEDGKDKCVKMEEETRDTYNDEVEKRNEKSRKSGAKKMGLAEEEFPLEEEPAKGKKSSKTYTNPDTGRKNKVSYGQKGAKIAPGTSKGDSYCARSFGIKKGLSKDKQNDPNTPNNLSRKKWKCSGEKSTK